MKTGTLLRIAVVVLAMTFAASMASAQAFNSGGQPIALNATLTESLTLSLSASALNFRLPLAAPLTLAALPSPPPPRGC